MANANAMEALDPVIESVLADIRSITRPMQEYLENNPSSDSEYESESSDEYETESERNGETADQEESRNPEDPDDDEERNSSANSSASSSNFVSKLSASSLDYYPSSPFLYSSAAPPEIPSPYLPSTPSLFSGSSLSGSNSDFDGFHHFVAMFLAARNEDEKKLVVDRLRRRYRTMEAASLRLQKESKGYLDSLRGKQTHRGSFRR